MHEESGQYARLCEKKSVVQKMFKMTYFLKLHLIKSHLIIKIFKAQQFEKTT